MTFSSQQWFPSLISCQNCQGFFFFNYRFLILLRLAELKSPEEGPGIRVFRDFWVFVKHSHNSKAWDKGQRYYNSMVKEIPGLRIMIKASLLGLPGLQVENF